MGINACEGDLPARIPETGILYLTVSRTEAWALLCSETRRIGLDYHEPFSDVWAVHVTATQLARLASVWLDAVPLADLENSKCLLTCSTEQPSNAELMQAQSLAVLIDWVNSQWLKELIEKERLLTHFQPIVCSAEPHVVYGYECLLRGRNTNGSLISPYQLYTVARRAGILDHLDDAARMKAIESAVRNQLDTRVFINFNPRSIEDPYRSLENALGAALASTNPPENYVFEVVESDEMSDTGALLEIAEHIRMAGCRVALDDVGAGYNSLNLISLLKPELIKLDMCMIRDVHRDGYKARVTSKLLDLARELNIQTVVEGVETTSEWQWACDHGADFAQGFLFARPAEDPPKSNFTDKVVNEANGSQDETMSRESSSNNLADGLTV